MERDPSRALVFAYPGAIETPSGGYEYDRRIIAGLIAEGWDVEPLSLGEGFPLASAGTRSDAYARLDALTSGTPVVVDGLALGALPEAGTTLGPGRPLLALVHHPLALESGLRRDEAERLHKSERQALSGARGVIVNSPATARALSNDYGIESGRIAIVPPGTERVPQRPRHRATGAPVRLLSVGSLVPRKGHMQLLGALAKMSDLPFQLDIAGTADFDPDHAEVVRKMTESGPLEGRVTLHGAVGREQLEALYQAADLFVLASRYEGYGMVYTEAVAHGLPVLASGAGAVADTVPQGAGLVFAPDEADDFAAALRRMVSDTAFREELAAGAKIAARDLPTWPAATQKFANAIKRFAGTPQ